MKTLADVWAGHMMEMELDPDPRVISDVLWARHAFFMGAWAVLDEAHQPHRRARLEAEIEDEYARYAAAPPPVDTREVIAGALRIARDTAARRKPPTPPPEQLLLPGDWPVQRRARVARR